MAQDTLYFPHDYDPLRDPKLRMLVKKRGVLGYGVYWRIIEVLHQSSDHLLKFDEDVYLLIADDLNVTPSDVETIVLDCINGCSLLDSNGEVFWSNRVMRNVDKRKEMSGKRSKAGKESARIRQEMKKLLDNHPELLKEIQTNDE